MEMSHADWADGGWLQIRLSESETVALGMPFKDRSGNHLRVELTRAKFDQLAAPLFSRARDALDCAAWQVLFSISFNSMVHFISATHSDHGLKLRLHLLCTAPY